MKIHSLLLASLLFVVPASAQTNNNPPPPPPRATGKVWLDVFGGPQGVVIYPQYSWKAETSAGGFGGYGFVEVAPHQPLFTNHLVVYTPPKVSWFSVHTETGGIPRKSLGFFQIAPRLNFHEAIPALKRPLSHLFIVALPRFVGIRPNNLLLSGGTNRFKVAWGLQASISGYRRFFPGNRPDYGEYWFLVHPKKTEHLSFGVFFLQNGNQTSVNFGIRISK